MRSTSPTRPRSRRWSTAVAPTAAALDGVVNAAGVAGGGPVHLLDAAEWDRVIAINLTGTFLAAST